ncbi:phospholipase [Endozoicomonas sp. OPT23]|nr:phospholipase [Endozoicomonas sp. OPT23]
MSFKGTCLSFVLLAAGNSALAATAFEECLLKKAINGDAHTNLKTIREECSTSVYQLPGVSETQPVASTPQGEEVELTAFDRRLQGERKGAGNRFLIMPHKPNYLLPVSWNEDMNRAPYGEGGKYLDNIEIKFQLSLKAPLVRGVWNGHGDLYVAYTNTSWWQAYNDFSAPFRETNHEPEVFASFLMNEPLPFGFRLRAVDVGLSHQSNGRSGSLSRSWNRIYAEFITERDNFYLGLKTWYRIPEPDDEKGENEFTSKKDDNPDIHNYMGYGELYMGYRLNRQLVAVMMRNNLKSGDNRGAIQVDWSFPLTRRFRGYVQYFNGYGESLIDYNASVNRLSVGVMLTDWL